MDPDPAHFLRDLRQEVLAYLDEEAFEYVEEGHTQGQRGYPPAFGIIKIAAVTIPDRSHVIHLLGTVQPDAATLIGTFDISTHQIAITHDGDVIKGPHWTPVTQLPEVISINVGKPTTPARMQKLMARYAH